MKAKDFRKLALALAEVEESAHMGRPDFRVRGKIFATLGAPDDDWGMVKVPPTMQASLIAAEANAFRSCNGAWGRSGCTLVQLSAAQASLVRAALEAAHQRAVEEARPKRRKRPGK